VIAAPPTTDARADTRKAPLALVVALADSLDDAGVRYCHWKSNAAIERSECGDNDLDLLVSHEYRTRFTEVLRDLGFLRTQRPGRELPGTENFYGCDVRTERLVHVHAHYELVLGHDATKNFRLPIEEAYLESAQRSQVLLLPSLDFEYIVFVLRMTLKYAIWDEIFWQALRRRLPRPKPSEQQELAYLGARCDPRQVAMLRERHLPYVDSALFQACVAILAGGASLGQRVTTARRLEHALRAHARHRPLADASMRFAWRARTAVQHRVRRQPRNRLFDRGVVVAILGGDGSGKSTALAEVARWLGQDFDVRRVHLGKPTWSLTTYVVRGGLKLAALAARPLQKIASVGGREPRPGFLATYRPMCWLVCTARDRYLTYEDARRSAAKGAIVLSDRYPHPRLQLMDRPQIARLTSGESRSALVRRMIKLEQRYHEAIGAADQVIVLKVDPEIAVRRKTTEPPESVRVRGSEIWTMDWGADPVYVVDAGQSKEEVAAELKRLVWSGLS
jgi:thymidylate kinase